ncbi:HIG1 domain-containing protein [uncultured Sphingomonas sp.]|uniref:HIG1 domain-containing protein n=1 Tax=uncultured Sphingomonas sp. TaxID=158754 RepID=UPI0025CFE6D7|nr:HIG1 domain-containing protein [uncultured Sphingomonas sp.]
MQTFLFVLIILAAIGALVSVVRGVIIMARTSREDLTGSGVSRSGLRQNRMMWRRIQFQGAAVVFVIILLLLSRGGTH